jgi:hypothetical protein
MYNAIYRKERVQINLIYTGWVTPWFQIAWLMNFIPNEWLLMVKSCITAKWSYYVVTHSSLFIKFYKISLCSPKNWNIRTSHDTSMIELGTKSLNSLLLILASNWWWYQYQPQISLLYSKYLPVLISRTKPKEAY